MPNRERTFWVCFALVFVNLAMAFFNAATGNDVLRDYNLTTAGVCGFAALLFY